MFLNPLMLIGVGAAVLPLLLHLLSRSRYKDVDWGAMMFLEGAEGSKRQSARFTQWFLLLLRSAVIALLALALARPLARGRWSSKETEGRVTAALVLDCSAAMAFDENGRSRFEMAQAAARQVIRGLRPGDRVCLILVGLPRAASELEPTGDLRSIEAKIDDAHVGYAKASFAEALDQAAEVLNRYERSARDVYVVCDKRSQPWQSVDAHFAGEWKRRMNGPGVHTRMFVLPVGSGDGDNIGVDSIRLLNPPAIVGQPADFEVVVRNFGPVQHAAVPVALEGSNLSLPTRSISLPPNQAITIPYTATFGQIGSQVLTASIKSAGFTGDDQLNACVNVISPIRVLVISGDEQQGEFGSESDFLKWALTPHRAAGVSGNDPCDVTILPTEKWPEDFAKYQVLVLANVERFTPQQAHSLERYVYSGGRLLIAPGSLSRIDEYNEQLYRDGAGIMPALLQPPTAADGSDSTSLLGIQIDHPVFQFLRGRFEIPSATIVRYFPAIPRQVDADVLARYLSNDPFLIEGRSGSSRSDRGRVLLMTTPLDADWSTLPLSNFYLPFVQSSIRYLAGGGVADGNLAPGDPIRMIFDDTISHRTATLTRPGGKQSKLDVIRLERQSEIRYADTEQPGVYRLEVQERGKPPRLTNFVVHPPRDESDLSPMAEDRWQWLQHSLAFTRVDPTSRPVLEIIAADREGRELWAYALAAAMLLSTMEIWIARVGSVQKKIAPPTVEDAMAFTRDNGQSFSPGARVG